jgi:hypothetical protein
MNRFSKWIGVIMVCFCVMGLSFSAQADENTSPSYIVLKGGIYSPQNEKFKNFDSGFNGEVSFGHYFNQYVALEAGSGYFKTRAQGDLGIGLSSAEGTLDFNVVPVTAALKLIIPLGIFELYGIGGGGAYFLWSDTKVSTNNQTAGSYGNYNQTLWGGFAGAGASIKVAPNVFLGLEGKYLWTSSLKINDIETNINLNGILATFNLGFLF